MESFKNLFNKKKNQTEYKSEIDKVVCLYNASIIIGIKYNIFQPKQFFSYPSNTIEDQNNIIPSGFGDVDIDRDLLLRETGISITFRAEIWQPLACGLDDKIKQSYQFYEGQQSSKEQDILRDIKRTFPGYHYFQTTVGQKALYKVSKAYSNYDEEIGYAQGLLFIIGTLLLQMNEEQSFNLFVKIMSRFQFREMFKTNLDVLHLRFYQLERLIQEYFPEVYDYFNALKISSHMFATEWFLTLYAAKFPLNLSIRVIDMYLNDGFTVVFLLALAIFDTSACELLMLDFDGIIKLLQIELPK